MLDSPLSIEFNVDAEVLSTFEEEFDCNFSSDRYNSFDSPLIDRPDIFFEIGSLTKFVNLVALEISGSNLDVKRHITIYSSFDANLLLPYSQKHLFVWEERMIAFRGLFVGETV